MCANATGTHKLPLLLIGKAKRPQCFRRTGPPAGTFYVNQKTAWADSARVQWWFDNVFLPEVRRRTSGVVALIWDNFATMHSATALEYSNEDGKRRRLYRISTTGLPLVCRP